MAGNQYIDLCNAVNKDLNEELDAMLYAFSHEVRAPLRSIDGFSQALEEDCAANLDEACLDYLRRIRKAVGVAENLIQATLRISRRTRGDIEVQDVNLTRLAREVTTWLEKTYPDHPVKTVIQEGLWARIDLRLARVLLEELFSNAWRFTRGIGKPLVEFGLVQGDPAAFFLRDNGVGLPEGHREDRMFGLFQVLHQEAGLSGQGTGLAVARRVVNRHGGSIRIKPGPDGGVLVLFTLPGAKKA